MPHGIVRASSSSSRILRTCLRCRATHLQSSAAIHINASSPKLSTPRPLPSRKFAPAISIEDSTGHHISKKRHFASRHPADNDLSDDRHAVRLRQDFRQAIERFDMSALITAYDNIDTYTHDVRRPKDDKLVLSKLDFVNAITFLRDTVGDESYQLLQRLFSDMAGQGYEINLTDYADLIYALALTYGQPTEAFMVLKGMLAEGINPNTKAYYKTLQGLHRRGLGAQIEELWDIAQQTLKVNPRDNDGKLVKLSDRFYELVILHLTNVGKMREAEDLLPLWLATEPPAKNQVEMSTTLLKGYAKAGEWDKAEQCSQQLLEHVQNLDAMSLSQLLAYVSRKPNADFAEVMNVFRQIKQPNAAHANILLRSAKAANDLSTLQFAIQVIESLGLEEDAIVRDMQVLALLHQGDLHGARDLFERFCDQKQEVDGTALSDLVTAYLKQGASGANDALEVYGEARTAGVCADPVCSILLVKYFAAQDELQVVDRLCTDIMKDISREVPPTARRKYGLFGSKSLPRAVKKIRISTGWTDGTVADLMYGLFLCARDPAFASRWHDRLFEANPDPFTKVVYGKIFEGLFPAPNGLQSEIVDNVPLRRDIALNMLSHMRRHRIGVDGVAYGILLTKWSRAPYNDPVGIAKLQALIKTDPSLDEHLLRNSLAAMYDRQGDLDKVLAIWGLSWKSRPIAPTAKDREAMSIGISTVIDGLGHMGGAAARVIVRQGKTPAWQIGLSEEGRRCVQRLENIWSVLSRRQPPRDGGPVPVLSLNNWDAYIEALGRLGLVEAMLNAITVDLKAYSELMGRDVHGDTLLLNDKMLRVATSFCVKWTDNVCWQLERSGMKDAAKEVNFLLDLERRVQKTWPQFAVRAMIQKNINEMDNVDRARSMYVQ